MNTMTKSTYLLPAALLMLASCSQEEPTTESDRSHGDKIIFRTSLPDVVSRAKAVYINDIDTFHVTAFNHAAMTDGSLETSIDNVVLKKDENSGFYSSADCQWPEKGHESDILQFFAYYPELPTSASLANGSSVSEGTANIDYKIKNYSIATYIPEQVDFVAASATGSMADNLFSGVAINFEHQLSRIEVNAWGANKSCDIEIAGVRIGGVNVKGTFDFNPAEGSGPWSEQEKGTVEYIFGNDDQIVTLSREKKLHYTSAEAASIMGAMIGSDNNCAMLIPTTDETGWNYGTDIRNGNQGMFISVLLRVIDKTPGGNDKQQYPYYDKSQGLNAMNIPRVVLAVDNDGKIKANFGQLYKGDNGTYYTDATKTTEYTYTVPEGCTVKEFGWAALPVTCNWEAGYVYTYTLDYSSGVGLHDPSVEDPADSTHGPKAGDPIISDRVGVSVSVNGWQGLNGKTTHTVEVPGS